MCRQCRPGWDYDTRVEEGVRNPVETDRCGRRNDGEDARSVGTWRPGNNRIDGRPYRRGKGSPRMDYGGIVSL